MTFSPTIPYPLSVAQTSTLGATTSSGSVALGTVGEVLLVQNDGSVTAYVALGTSAVTATAGGTATLADGGSVPVLAGASMLFRAGPGVTHLAGITASGTTTIRASRGDGT